MSFLMNNSEEIVKEKNPSEMLYTLMSGVPLSKDDGRDKRPGLGQGV